MVAVKQDGDNVVFDVKGMHKLWALKSKLFIPRSHILAVRHDPSIVLGWKGWKIPGMHIPGVMTAGTFYLDEKRNFRDVRNGARAIVIDLANKTYHRLIIEVGNPDKVASLLSNTGVSENG